MATWNRPRLRPPTRRRGIVVICAGLWLVRAVFFALTGPVRVEDSTRYANVGRPFAAFHISQGRGPGVLLQSLFLVPHPVAVVGQVILAAVLWGMSLALLTRGTRGRWSTVGVLWLVWMMSPWFVLWDGFVLTEALTLAGVSLVAVAATLTALDPDRPPVTALAAGVAVATLTRPLVFPLTLGTALLAVLCRRLVQGSPVFTRGRSAAVAGLAWLALAVFAGVQSYQFEHCRYLSGTTMPNVRAADRLIGRGGTDAYQQAAVAHGMPLCDRLREALDAPASNARKDAIRRQSICPGYAAWLDAGGLSWEDELAASPGTMLGAFVSPTTWVDANVQGYARFTPAYRKAVTSPSAVTHTRRLARMVDLAEFGLLALMVVLAVPALRRHRCRLPYVGAMTLGLVASWWLLWATDGIESWRHCLPAIAMVPGVAVAVIAVHRRPHDGPGEPVPPRQP